MAAEAGRMAAGVRRGKNWLSRLLQDTYELSFVRQAEAEAGTVLEAPLIYAALTKAESPEDEAEEVTELRPRLEAFISRFTIPLA